ncbi:hypothetical protein DENSPDRAFT_499399 [Dentipellis sp. KUC8613]|nr:hypothetical protein DENSPDRAFT_499399 [Dentipellis sp. KUC8613]
MPHAHPPPPPLPSLTALDDPAHSPAHPSLHGLTYDPAFLSALPVLLPRPAPHTPIRALSAAQFADIHLRYLLSHAPDNVLFPFLHGLEGDNQAQNLFFAASGARPDVPRFRGLIWVASDDDTLPQDEDARQRELELSQREREHMFSDDEEFESERGSSDIDIDDDEDDEDDDTFSMDIDSEADALAEISPYPLPFAPSNPEDQAAHMHPVHHRAPPIDTNVPKSSPKEIYSTSGAGSQHSPNASTSEPASPTPSALSISSPSPSTPPTSISSPSSPCPSSLSSCLAPSLTGSPTHTPPSHALLTSTFRPRDLLTVSHTVDGKEFEFIPPRVPDGISLRNFGIQVPIYATLSDIVIYCPSGTDGNGMRGALALAEKFKQAIEIKAAARRKNGPSTDGVAPQAGTEPVEYNVFVLDASVGDMQKELVHLVRRIRDEDGHAQAQGGAHTDGTDAHVAPEQQPPRACHRPANTVDFAQREKDEMRDLTRASEILALGDGSSGGGGGGVHLGNANDVPLPEGIVGVVDPFDGGANALGFDVCVECCDLAPCPGPAELRAAEEHLARMEDGWAQQCRERGEVGAEDDAAVPPRPAPNAGAVVHLPFPSAPPCTTAGLNALCAFVEFVQRVIEPPGYDGAADGKVRVGGGLGRRGKAPTRASKVLIYSSDGYTESSVLALCLVMALKGMSLPEAYLELQVAKKRSFFVYHSDLSLLRRFEAKLSRERPTMRLRAPTHSGTQHALSASFEEHSPFSGAKTQHGRPRASTSPLLPSLVSDHQVWFDDPRFDGSFPSRVLPFLYLGNLNHASNAYMLHALGITHVVSVGECALVPPAEPGPKRQGSLFIEEREGRIKVLDIKGVCDDGIDTLEPQLGPICEWIDRAREEGGQVLVHCRVGVSRSATVTIAYVMKHLALPLVDAYLVVRSRRLSVLIQPNMRLLYNLCGWEVKLARERAGGDEARLRGELARALNWPFLAREVHALNEKYLH